jgi:hypothetical protein
MKTGKFIFALFLGAVTVLACAKPGTYVLFAANARDDRDMEKTPTLRLPMDSDQPPGAMIFCEAGKMRVEARKLDGLHVAVRDPDGLERTLETPGDGAPVGLITFWPDGAANRCGLASETPVNSLAFVLWGEFFLVMKRIEPDKMFYRLGEKTLVLGFPLSEADRKTLADNAVPERIANLLP